MHDNAHVLFFRQIHKAVRQPLHRQQTSFICEAEVVNSLLKTSIAGDVNLPENELVSGDVVKFRTLLVLIASLTRRMPTDSFLAILIGNVLLIESPSTKQLSTRTSCASEYRLGRATSEVTYSHIQVGGWLSLAVFLSSSL